jgi:hypothetical protein
MRHNNNKINNGMGEDEEKNIYLDHCTHLATKWGYGDSSIVLLDHIVRGIARDDRI